MFNATENFSEELYALIDLPPYDDSARINLSHIACSLAFEHWEATLQLLKAGNFPSAVVVHRVQFETILRSVWLLYAATDEQLTKLSASLTDVAAHNAKSLPQATDMLAAIEKKGPPPAFDALSRFKDNSWQAMNSYVHAGIHPIKRHADGYPLPLIEGIARNANGLATVSAMQAAVLAGHPTMQREILSLAARYSVCMPPTL
jgi:hypothetical protein